jgi:lysophospholipase L1-like esterase
MTNTFLHRLLGSVATTGIGLLFLLGIALAQEQGCMVPTRFYETEPTLSQTTAALASGRSVLIVVIGSASSLGDAAGSADLAWPMRLAVALGSRFPAAQVKVVNRAVAGQTAQEIVSRLDREVIALQPTLVIWETGTTDAVYGTDPDEFRQTMQAGIDQLHTSGIEIMCMDMQFSRQTHAIINFDRYESVLREVTDANDVPLFHRHDIMHYWVEDGVFDLTTNDHGKLQRVASRLYDCIGRGVADLITRGVDAEASTIPAHSRSHP